MKRTLIASLALLLVAAGLCTVQAQVSPLKRVAIFPIKTDAGIVHFWEGDFDPAQTVTDTLTTKLVNSGAYAVFDRSHLDTIMQEQNMGTAGIVDPATAVRVGKLAGVQYIITGAVTHFAMDQSGGSGLSIGGFGGGGGNKKLHCEIQLHVTNVKTGQISGALEGDGEDTISGGGVHGRIGIFSGGTHNEETAASGYHKAIEACVDQAVGQMANLQFQDVQTAPSLSGTIIDIAGGQITLNVGSKQGIVEGMKFSVSRPRTIIDPTTHQPRQLKSPVGTLTVIAVDTDTCTCKAAPGSNTFKVRDIATTGD